MSEVTIGQIAPDFWLPTDLEDSVTPVSLKGKTIILYFYPKDDTTGCTAQAIAFSSLKAEFERANAVVIGVSKDKLSSHTKFRQKYDLTIILASDFDNNIAENFGVWVEKSMYGREYMGMERSTFVIDANQVVRHIWRKVKVAGHGEEVLRVVQKMSDPI
jgi:thioredoxin-dependent peroxiredoxin